MEQKLLETGEMQRAEQILKRIREGINQVMVGKDDVVELMLAALIAGGHILVEDVPGLGKTTMVEALASAVDCSYSRVQFTPDVTPSDITGFTMYQIQTGEKAFCPGAVMSQILLADEINRTTPKTQSALLQAMQEGRVSVDGETYELPRPFMVLATQNPAELTGTYPLPEAQLDRFLLCVQMGYPEKHQEVEILKRHQVFYQKRAVDPVCTGADIVWLQQAVDRIICKDPILNYIVTICDKTREHQEISLGVSPRGAIALMRASMAWALLQGRDYVLPDDVQALCVPVLAHRIVLKNSANLHSMEAEGLLRRLLGQTAVPIVR